jgi:hypothetical protein
MDCSNFRCTMLLSVPGSQQSPTGENEGRGRPPSN